MEFTVKVKNENGRVKIPRLNKDHAEHPYRSDLTWKMTMRKLFRNNEQTRVAWDRVSGCTLSLDALPPGVTVVSLAYITTLKIVF